MKGSRFLLLVLAAAILAAIGWCLHRSEKGSWHEQPLPTGSGLLAEFPVNDVAVVKLQGDGGAVTLRRSDSGWVVGERAGYPSNFDKVSALVRKVAGIKAVQEVPVAEADLGRLALRRPGEGVPAGESALSVDLLDAQGVTLVSLLLGKTHYTTPTGMRPEIGGVAAGRYVRTEGCPGHAYLVAETFTDVLPAPAAWIDQTFVRPGMAKRVEVKAAGADRSWAIERDAQGAAWKLAGAKKNESVDSQALLSIDSLLAGMAVADAPDGADDARVKPLEENPVTVVADSFDGIRYTFTIGEGGGDNLPVKVRAEALPGAAPVAASPQVAAAPAQAPDAAAKQQAEADRAREEKLAAASRFQDRVVFIPRNFVAPFLRTRPVVATASPSPTPVPKKK